MNVTEKKIKKMQIGQEEVQLSLFTDNVILYIRDSKDYTLTLLEELSAHIQN